ncbi:MAG TPA: alpha-L-arabinofuranosidase C-terminal domain-containing protein [Polyangiaceae bacterium]|nr:alpha-L-arabinofuranosidase C-terminal domain-containing protein [Polyangiaceae bacterium]
MTRIPLSALPLLPALVFAGCGEDAKSDPGATPPGTPAAAGTTSDMPAGAAPTDGTPAGGAPTAGAPTEGNVTPGGIDDNQPPPTGVVECDESSIGGVAPNTLSVAVNEPATVIPKEIFGVLLEILGNNINNGIFVGPTSGIPNTRGIRNDIIEGFKEAGVGAMQWPGGCAANNYNWEPNLNPINTMGTDAFMELTQLVGAEPYLVGRPGDQFADSNRRWVEYINDNPEHPEWKLQYFKVGNEVWGCGGNLGHEAAGLATYTTWYDANYAALSPPINGKDLFLVGATAGIWTVNPNTDNWLTLMSQPNGIVARMDGIEIHDYLYFPDGSGTPIPNVGFSEDQYYNIVNRANAGQIAPRLRDIDSILDRSDPEGRVKVMLDEWGDWLVEFDPSDTWLQKGTLMDAISAGIHLNVFMEHADRVLMAGLAQSTNVIHSLFLTNTASGGTDLVKTPTFYVFKLYLPHHVNGATWVPHTLTSETLNGNGQSIAALSAGTTVDASGGVNVSLVNVDLVNSRTIDVTLDSEWAAYGVSSAQVITGAQKDTYNDFGQPEAVNIQPLDAAAVQACGRKVSVTIPAKSVAMLRLDRR